MKKLFLLLAAAVCCTALAPEVLHARRPEKVEKKVMAFYYPWYGTPEVSGEWKHWSWVSGEPNALNEDGYPDLKIPFHPGIGVYDSNDPEVVRYHLELAEKAGIDVLISSWWGQGDYTDRSTMKLFDVIEETGSPVRATVYYEYVPDKDPDRAVEDFIYIIDDFGGRDAFFRVGGVPVIFIYGRAMADIELKDWYRVVKELNEKRKVLLIADMDFFAVFDGVHRYNPAMDVRRGTATEKIYANLMDVGRRKNLITAVSVIPGYDDVLLERELKLVAGRRDGDLYREMWEGAIALDPDRVLITSFNEWHEGTPIEPALQFGDKYITQT